MRVAAVVIATIAYRHILSWPSLVASLLLVILFIPIRRYTLPGDLPFELEPYRLLVAFLVLGWGSSLLIDPRVRLLEERFRSTPRALYLRSSRLGVGKSGPRCDKQHGRSEGIDVLPKLRCRLLPTRQRCALRATSRPIHQDSRFERCR